MVFRPPFCPEPQARPSQGVSQAARGGAGGGEGGGRRARGGHGAAGGDGEAHGAGAQLQGPGQHPLLVLFLGFLDVPFPLELLLCLPFHLQTNSGFLNVCLEQGVGYLR